jgi:hypothetical protein
MQAAGSLYNISSNMIYSENKFSLTSFPLEIGSPLPKILCSKLLKINSNSVKKYRKTVC